MSTSESSQEGRVSRSAAEVYDEYFVPALFEPWAVIVADAAALRPGDRVLDVGCGTGVLARHAAERVGQAGAVVGVDPNEDMLRVAKQGDARAADERDAGAAAPVEWRVGSAERLPFDDASFDAVVCQFVLMFVPRPAAAVAEMKRVAGPNGRIAIAVWDALENLPAYAAVHALLRDVFGDGAAAALEPPFALGDLGKLHAICAEAGVPDAAIRSETATARFPSIRSWMHTEIRGWTLADRIDEPQFEELAAAAEKRLALFRQHDGSVTFELRAHVVTA